MIKDVIRLKWEAQLSHDKIATALGISKGVVQKYLALAGAAQLDWDTVRDWDEARLQQALLPGSRPPSVFVEPDWARVHQDLRVLTASGGLGKWLLQLTRVDVLLLDDWGVGPNDSTTRSALLEIVDDRASRRATIITQQLPVEHWHGWIGDATIADAILDRLLQRVHRFKLEGHSRRTGTPQATTRKPTPASAATAA